MDLCPQNPLAWLNIGRQEEQLYLFADAENSYRRGMAVAKNDDQKGTLLINWAALCITMGAWDAAETMARKALKYKPDSKKARANLGMACLAQRNWKEGWPLYDEIIGFEESRRLVKYGNEPDWDGSKKSIVLYGEQGLGDEISFASMIPDALKAASRVVIDCEPRLEGLFKRSFPEATVYGTLKSDASSWAVKDRKPDASLTTGGLGKLFRNEDSAFPGEPYLVADPDRVDMWRGLFAKQGKPVIGVAWTGGVSWTGDRFRKLTLEQLLPVFRKHDAVFVSLQYKDASKEIAAFRAKHPEVDLRQYAFGTLTKDYDDTAAMVQALDRVIAMRTAVIHLAGALGVKTDCLVNREGQWRYGTGQKTLPWYKSVTLHWQRADGSWPLAEI